MVRQENEAVIALVTSDTLSDTLSFLLYKLVFSRVLSTFREENKTVSALAASDTLSATFGGALNPRAVISSNKCPTYLSIWRIGDQQNCSDTVKPNSPPRMREFDAH